jgi:peptide/nickel transport system substrate-binding protein
MNMAIDRNSIKKNQFGGEGDAFPYPFAYVKEYDPLYYKQADWTQEIKDIYTYNPEGAKKLLADAGYPNGFKTSMTVAATNASEMDMAQIFLGYWSKIGVTVDLHPVDATIKMNMEYAWTHDPIIPETTGPLSIFMIGNTFYGVRYNLSTLTDPKIDQYLNDCRGAAITDLTKSMKIYRDFSAYALTQAWHVPDVSSPASLFYWPWLKNYDGEITIGYDDMSFSWYLWIDQSLKAKMGY